MRLEGLCPCRFPGKTDCHPKKLGPGWHNWWEVDMQHITPRSMRKQELKEEIKRQGYLTLVFYLYICTRKSKTGMA